ncbi:hypothetical protein [Streptomyces sp. TRM68367]|uniref:hypothetical protein n=1 Tax=Streptomyces sp. TRM68367 TaxID=2758415 RepID=UPI00165B1244|nr:hypothetical protein [Streptomyces sp. TRM68367]MBC9724354.1 hypothetical protein [Streptomyces sp. TRM68367]
MTHAYTSNAGRCGRSRRRDARHPVLPAAAAPSPGQSGTTGVAVLDCPADVWRDPAGNTFGGMCTGNGNYKFRATAVCRNGQTVYGTTKWATGGWSYAYCAGKGGLTGDVGYEYWRGR